MHDGDVPGAPVELGYGGHQLKHSNFGGHESFLRHERQYVPGNFFPVAALKRGPVSGCLQAAFAARDAAPAALAIARRRVGVSAAARACPPRLAKSVMPRFFLKASEEYAARSRLASIPYLPSAIFTGKY
jgi:hypothetical protein